MEEKNIYILSYEYGAKHMENGIKYSELIQHLESLQKKPKGEFEKYFHIWFYKNFWVPDITFLLNNAMNTNVQTQDYIKNFDIHRGILTADAYSEYLEYLTLQQARSDSRKANIIAISAIIISIVLAGIQIYYQLKGNK